MKNDGGPAFPVVPNARPGEWATAYPGMTLRDYFAGQCINPILRNNQGMTVLDKDLAKLCYQTADAMLAERDKADV